MTAFPDVLTGVSPANPWQEQLVYRTVKTDMDNGDVITKQKWLYPRRVFNLAYRVITTANAATLYNFYTSMAGGFGRFSLFLPFSSTYTNEYVAVGDGSTLSFNLPALGITAYTVKVDGSTMTEGAGNHYTITSLGGADGEDLLVFTAGNAPPAGDHVTVSFTGRLKVRCRFAVDEMNFENFYNRIVSTGITIQGELNNG